MGKRLRTSIAVLLVAGAVALDLSGKRIAGLSSEGLFRAICLDYETEILEKGAVLIKTVRESTLP